MLNPISRSLNETGFASVVPHGTVNCDSMDGKFIQRLAFKCAVWWKSLEGRYSRHSLIVTKDSLNVFHDLFDSHSY